MKPLSFLLPMFWYIYLHLLLFFTLNSMCFGPNRIVALAFRNQTDPLALLKFKESISSDPSGILDSWNGSTHFCKWRGITCSPMHQRVTDLNLQGYHLRGSISPHVGNLSFMRNLNLADNSFFGKISQELGRLQLHQLYLTNNSFVGEVPSNLTNCSNLKVLYLRDNNLFGKIPIAICSLQKLQVLRISGNNLIGGVPPYIGNLSSLTELAVGSNNSEGDIPQEICRLKNLTFISVGVNRLSDVASAFHYLHYECEQPVIHCDLKPSNVLLDDCMVAHVSDFGLARLLYSVGVSLMQSSITGIKGTVGYAPPEYGMGSEVSIEGDVYSFGILLLEMLSGRRPTDEMFEDSHNLHNYVKNSISNNLLQIVDPTLIHNELEWTTDNGNLGIMHPNVEKCLLSLFSIAIACSVESPNERMSMVDAIRELNIIKSFFPAGVQRKQAALQPQKI